MFEIEPLLQSDRDYFQLLLFRLTGTQARVNFCSPHIRWAKGKSYAYQAGIFHSADYGDLSELQGRNDGYRSYTDFVRRSPRKYYLSL